MKWVNYKKRIFRRIGKSLGKIAIFSGVVCFVFCGMSLFDETKSYFNDTEDSNTNVFSVGALDFSINSGDNFSPTSVKKSETTTRTITLENDGSLGFQYDVKVSNLSGDACDYLNFSATLDGADVGYSGLVKDFTHGPIVFASPETWVFSATLQAGTPDSIQGRNCQFDIEFNGWQNGLTFGQGFSDQEMSASNIWAGYWNPPVVLNEFLPNAGEYPEFIEIYNQTSSDIDLNGFYVMADSNKILIDSTTTATYSGGSTIVLANGWLVVAAGGDLINNSAGTIILYDSNDVVLDTYSYGGATSNSNNTPGWTNNLVDYLPLDGDALDKSNNLNNGTNNGATFVSGKINQALSFDGADDYVEVPHSSSLNIGGNGITLEAWVNLNSLPASGKRWIVLNKNGAYALQVADGGRVRVYLGPLTSYVQTDSAEISVGSWYHVVATYDASDIKIYVNGALKKQVAKTGNQSISTDNLVIGAKSPDGYLNGLIDEVKIYGRTLSSSEVLDHYNAAGVGGTVPVDKSYARIPDGSSNWVDPIPSPGKPNVLENEQPQEVVEAVQSTEEVVSEVEQTNQEQAGGISAQTQESEIIEIINNEVEEFVDEAVGEVVPEIQPITQEVEEDQEEVQEDEPEVPASEELVDEVIEETIEPIVEEQSVEPEQVIEEQPIIEQQPVIVPSNENPVPTDSNTDEANSGAENTTNDSGTSSDLTTQ